MARKFDLAKRENVWLRMLLMGADGSGKTKQALEVASLLFGGGLDIVVVDSQRGQSKLYADRYRFFMDELVDHSPESYMHAMHDAAEAFPGGVLVIDSISHEWMGTNGVLQDADRFGDWKQVRPRHSQFMETLLGLPMHVIATCRLKTKYEVSETEVNGRKKQVVTKLGLGPVQDDSLGYNFDVVGRIDLDTHETTFSNRCEPLVDKTFNLIPGFEVAEVITEWLSAGDPPEVLPEADPKDVKKLVKLLREEGISQDKVDRGFAVARRENRGKLSPEYVATKTAEAQARAEKRKPAAEEAKAPEPLPQAQLDEEEQLDRAFAAEAAS